MKNIFKTLFVFLLGMFCTYVVWVAGCLIFSGRFLGVITEEEGLVAYVIATVISIIFLFVYLTDNEYYD